MTRWKHIYTTNKALFLRLGIFAPFESGDISTRVRIERLAENVLLEESFVMTDKIVTVDKSLLGKLVGALSDEDMAAISNRLKIILDL